jgi:hypothetical protein
MLPAGLAATPGRCELVLKWVYLAHSYMGLTIVVKKIYSCIGRVALL